MAGTASGKFVLRLPSKLHETLKSQAVARGVSLNTLCLRAVERLDELVRISRALRRDRELAFYGSEDLTPSEFYTEADAAAALGQARRVHAAVSGAMMGGG